jgi:hypothetical protein
MTEERNFPYRVGLVQRVLPRYRADFFDSLAKSCPQGFSVVTGKPRPQEAIETTEILRTAQLNRLRNIHIFQGRCYFCYQAGL